MMTLKIRGKAYSIMTTVLAVLLVSPTPLAQKTDKDKLLPQRGKCSLLRNDHYSVCYQSNFKNSMWTFHELTMQQVQGTQKRTNDYRRDHRIPNPVESYDYRNSGFDRGHLVPAADMKQDHSSMSQTFYMSNMSPQRPEFNRGIWSVLEKKIRKDFINSGLKNGVFVYTGSILSEGLPTLASQVAIPVWFYKVIYNPSKKIVRSYLIDNYRYSSQELESFRVSVDTIEELSGLDFFTHLSLEQQQQLESKI